MQACHLPRSVAFLESVVTNTTSCVKHVVVKFLDLGTLNAQQGPEQNKDQSPRWISTIANDLNFPEELPASCPHHMVQLQGHLPAMAMNKRLFKYLKYFAEDFRQLEQLEQYFRLDLAAFNKEVDRIDNAIDDCQTKKDQIAKCIAEKEALPDTASFKERISPFLRRDVDKLQAQLDRLREQRRHKYQESTECVKEMQKVRRDMIPAQFGLSQKLCDIFEEAGLMESKKEQYVGDRKEIRALPLRYMRWRAIDPDLPPKARGYLQREGGIAAEAGSIRANVNDDLAAALDEYEISHWNRRVAHEEFMHRKQLMGYCQKKTMHEYKIGESEWHDMEQAGLKEGARLTRALIDAESGYRGAAARLRELNQSIVTVDSSRFTSISSGPLSETPDHIRVLKSRKDFEVAVWRACLRLDGVETDEVRSTTFQGHNDVLSSEDSVGFHEGYSGRNGWAWHTDDLAMRQRAWAKENFRRDSRQFSQRQRWKVNKAGSNGDTSGSISMSKKDARKYKSQRHHLARWTTGDGFPSGRPPVYSHKVDDMVSWSSQVTGEAKQIVPFLRRGASRFSR